MHGLKMLQQLSSGSLGGIHASRPAAVWVGVSALLRGQRLWLTALGRCIGGTVKEKHSIKRIDRLLGSAGLATERGDWYGWIAGVVLGGCRRAVILVDWSNLDGERRLYVLRAAVAVGGRALPIYEEVHEQMGDRHLHRRFLSRLAALLGEGCRPILVAARGRHLVVEQGLAFRGAFEGEGFGALVAVEGLPAVDSVLLDKETAQGSDAAHPLRQAMSLGSK